MTPEYLKKLEGGNVGVVLGRKSGGLVAIDLDLDRLVEPFLTANPSFKGTLQTHGRRGRVFWLRMVGDYPAKTVKLKTHSGDDAGEWRAGPNTQSIIHGIHPDTGSSYQVDFMASPMVVSFASIVWPDEISNPPRLNPPATDRGTEEPDDTDDTDEVRGSLLSVRSVEDVLRKSTPSAENQNYNLAFVLARGVKALEIQAGRKFTPQEHLNIHQQWLALSDRYLRPGQSHSDYFVEYLSAYKLAKYPLGSVVVAQAVKAAKTNPLPAGMLTWTDNSDIHLLAAICRELQSKVGNEPFYLSVRMVQKIFRHDTHSTGAKWLRSLCVMGVLDEVEKGIGLRATRYRFQFSGN